MWLVYEFSCTSTHENRQNIDVRVTYSSVCKEPRREDALLRQVKGNKHVPAPYTVRRARLLTHPTNPLLLIVADCLDKRKGASKRRASDASTQLQYFVCASLAFKKLVPGGGVVHCDNLIPGIIYLYVI